VEDDGNGWGSAPVAAVTTSSKFKRARELMATSRETECPSASGTVIQTGIFRREPSDAATVTEPSARRALLATANVCP